MITKNTDVARSVSEVLNKTFVALGDSIIDVNKSCSEEEAAEYRDKIGDIFWIITFKLLEPLYEQHPELKPADWTEFSPRRSSLLKSAFGQVRHEVADNPVFTESSPIGYGYWHLIADNSPRKTRNAKPHR